MESMTFIRTPRRLANSIQPAVNEAFEPEMSRFAKPLPKDIIRLWRHQFGDAVSLAEEMSKCTERPIIIVRLASDDTPCKEDWGKLSKSGILMVSVANKHEDDTEVTEQLCGDTLQALQHRARGLQKIARPTVDTAALEAAQQEYEQIPDAPQDEKQSFLQEYYARTSDDDGTR